ncbi:MAG: hypothetical protein K9L82_05900, partial [Chromatiaceae bacterium]|nr:hypothetical protein [Chromatiaceae bacterium]
MSGTETAPDPNALASETSDQAGGQSGVQSGAQSGARASAQAGAQSGTDPAGATPDNSKPANRRRRFRPLRWIGSLIVVTLTLVVLLLVFVLGTQTGLRTLFA